MVREDWSSRIRRRRLVLSRFEHPGRLPRFVKVVPMKRRAGTRAEPPSQPTHEKAVLCRLERRESAPRTTRARCGDLPVVPRLPLVAQVENTRTLVLMDSKDT